jgi:hypothetical protein
MSANAQGNELPLVIRQTLDRLRHVIQRYVVLQAAVLALIAAICLFWLTGFLDYFPVMMGASESPRWARVVMLALVVLTLGWIVYRFGWRKWWVRWKDSSLALLLERRYPELGHSLVTTVQAAQPEIELRDAAGLPADEILREATRRQAMTVIEGMDVERVLQWQPLRGQLGVLGGLLAVSLLAVLWQPMWAWHWTKRLFALSDTAWPRMSSLGIDGIEIDIPSFSDEEGNQRYVRSFRDGMASIPRGQNGRFLAYADLRAKKVPEACVLAYRSFDGVQGRATLVRRETSLDGGRQAFVLEGPPMQAIDQSLAMSLRGGDARIAGLRLEVIDPPQVVQLKLAVKYPEYLRRRKNSTWLDEELDFRMGMRLPEGTELALVGLANMPLARCEGRWAYTDSDGQSISRKQEVACQSPQFRLPMGVLRANSLFEIRLWEQSGHCSTKVQQYVIGIIPDELPSVDLVLDGIGTAVTENAVLPVVADCRDDHDLAEGWLELETSAENRWQQSLEISSAGQAKQLVDLRTLRDSRQFLLNAGQNLSVNLYAKDYFDLDDQRRVGRASPIQLAIVTADQLLVILDRRELAMRGRLELVISEFNQLQELLVRIRQTNRELLAAKPAVVESTDPTGSEEAPGDRLQSPRAQQAVMQLEKSAGELLGIEKEIQQIHQELIHNRIDSKDRQERLEGRVRQPLQAVREGSFNELQQRTKAMEKALEKGPLAEATIAATIVTLEETLAALDSILKAMIDLQDFNEVVDMVRSMVDDQGRLIDRTKAEQKQRLLDQFK